MDSLQEEWRDSRLAPGYQVSSLGRVRRSEAVRSGRKHATESLVLRDDRSGVPHVHLKWKGNSRPYALRRLVCDAFCSPVTGQHYVRNLDGDLHNCTPGNLEAFVTIKHEDLSGKAFGFWTVIERAADDKSRNRRWRCRCVCGKVKTVGGISLKASQTQSCGCKRRELLIAKVGQEKHYKWLGGIDNPGSLAWCNLKLGSLRYACKRRDKDRIVSTAEDVQNLWVACAGRCAACGSEPDSMRALHLDHDHETGVVRGFLCNTCNVALGMVRDSPERLRQLAEYLERIAHRQGAQVVKSH